MGPILLVDDDDDYRESLRLVLEEEGYAVGVARNGKEALDAMLVARPALVVIDALMPVMGGVELLANMGWNDELREIPTILMSGTPHGDRAHFLLKPFATSELVALVGLLLTGPAV